MWGSQVKSQKTIFEQGGNFMGAKNNVVQLGDKPSMTKKPSRPVTERQARPAASPEAREAQMVSLAVDLAEKQLRDGTASAAVLTHYLKMASNREQLEREILKNNAELSKAKASSIQQGAENENLTKQAIEALTSYTPSK